MPIVATCAVGVSFGLPLFLMLREIDSKKIHDSLLITVG
ncbi:DUF2834 domain-containing protein [Kaarinaea lacus]